MYKVRVSLVTGEQTPDNRRLPSSGQNGKGAFNRAQRKSFAICCHLLSFVLTRQSSVGLLRFGVVMPETSIVGYLARLSTNKDEHGFALVKPQRFSAFSNRIVLNYP
jgi:hypothetical protein